MALIKTTAIVDAIAVKFKELYLHEIKEVHMQEVAG